MFILLIGELLIILFLRYIVKREIMSPALLSVIVFFIATFLCYLETVLWDVRISGMTIFVILSTLLVMCASEAFGKKIKTPKKYRSNNNDLRIIRVRKKICLLWTISVVLCTLAYAYNAYRVGLLNGGNGLNAFAYMKEGYMSGIGARMNPIVRQFYKYVISSSFISAFLIANNIAVLKDKLTKNVNYVIIFLCGGLITIASGARTDILKLITGLLLDYVVLYSEKNKWTLKARLNSSKEVIKKGLPIAVCVIIVAYVSRTIVKTSNVLTSEIGNVFAYFAYYIGSPIAVLNVKINTTFTLKNIFTSSFVSPPEFVYLGNLNYGGNVATIIGKVLFEYGYFPLLVHITIIYFIGGIIYYKYLQKTYSSKGRNRLLIVISMLYNIFSMSYYSDLASGLFDGITMILTIIVLIVLYNFLSEYFRFVD